jgi:hypothetical protein
LFGHPSFAQNKCKMMFFEDYDKPSIYEFNNQLSKQISDGYFFLEGFEKKRIWMIYYPIDIDETENFEIETSIKRISAAKKRYTYGIIYGSDRNNYYSFRINSKGAFKFQKYADGEYEQIIPLTKSEYIIKGIGRKNKLRINKEGDTVYLYVNDNFLVATPFESFFGNNIGFFIAREQKIAIDYLKVIYLPPPQKGTHKE